MKRFRFGLQRLLDYKATVEDVLLAELAALQAEHERETARLARAIGDRDAFRLRLGEMIAGADAERARDAFRYLAELSRRVSLQTEAVREVEERMRTKTEQVLEAAKERKALQRLRARGLESHRREHQRQEQLFLDDVATIRHARANGEEQRIAEEGIAN